MLKIEFDSFYQKGYYEVLEQYKVDNAVIMAAGVSSHLRPLSEKTPKALLKVKGEILIERMIRQLYEAGIDRIYVVVGYKKELFSYLEEKFHVILVDNPDYAVRGNHSSIYAVRKYLGNTYICPADNYFMENVFESHVYQPYCSAVYMEEPADRYCLSTGFNGRITHVHTRSSNTWCAMGHAYWNRAFSKQFTDILEAEYDLPGTMEVSWQNIYFHHLDTLTLFIKKYPNGIIHKFDDLNELCQFDTSYIPYRDTLKNAEE